MTTIIKSADDLKPFWRDDENRYFINGDCEIDCGNLDVGGYLYVGGNLDVHGYLDVGGYLYWNKPMPLEKAVVKKRILPTAYTRDFWAWALREVPAVQAIIASGACYEAIFKAVAENSEVVKAVAENPNTAPVVAWVINSWLKDEV
jgi:hypothetical protein